MTLFRRYLRPCALAWFVLQAASLSALMPADCCTAHEPQPLRPLCHDASERRPDGAPDATSVGHGTHATHGAQHGSTSPQPAHMDHATGHRDAAPGSAAERCVIRGTCDGPPLFTVFSQPGVVAGAPVVFPHLDPLPDAVAVSERSVARPDTPDPRPPRL